MVIKLCVEQLWSEIILVISTQNRPELCNCQTKYNVTFIYQWKKEQNINKSEMKVKLSKNTFITKLYKSVRSDWLICSLHLPAGCMLTQGLLALFFFFFVHEMKDVWKSQCYKRNGQRAASNHRVMVHAGGCYARKKCKSRTRRER